MKKSPIQKCLDSVGEGYSTERKLELNRVGDRIVRTAKVGGLSKDKLIAAAQEMLDNVNRQLGQLPPISPQTAQAAAEDESVGAARNAEAIRQAAARLKGTEKGPDLGFAKQQPTGKKDLQVEPDTRTEAGMPSTPPQRDPSKPEQMTPEEWGAKRPLSDAQEMRAADLLFAAAKKKGFTEEGTETPRLRPKEADAALRKSGYNHLDFKTGLVGGARLRDGVGAYSGQLLLTREPSRGEVGHRSLLLESVSASLPVSAEAVDAYGITLPEGYVRQGDLYVFQPSSEQSGLGAGAATAPQGVIESPTAPKAGKSRTAQAAAETQTPTPSRKGAGAAGGTEPQSAKGSILAVESTVVQTPPVPSAEKVPTSPAVETPTESLPADEKPMSGDSGTVRGTIERRKIDSTFERILKRKSTIPLINGMFQVPYAVALKDPSLRPTNRDEQSLRYRTSTKGEVTGNFNASDSRDTIIFDESVRGSRAPRSPATAVPVEPPRKKAADKTPVTNENRASGREEATAFPATDIGQPDAPVITPAKKKWKPNVGDLVSGIVNGVPVVGKATRVSQGGRVDVEYAPGKIFSTNDPVPAAQALATAPKYQYTQEQNTAKAARLGLPTAPGVTENAGALIQNVLVNVSKDTRLSPLTRAIARALRSVNFDGVRLRIKADGRSPAGLYTHENGVGEIMVNLRAVARGQVDSIGVFLHEALHHATMEKLFNPAPGIETEAVDAIKKIVDHVKALAGPDTVFDYELSNPWEFVSALFTRPDFQNYLATVPAPDSPTGIAKFRSALSELFRRLAELVTGQKVQKGSTMEQAIAATMVLFETPQRTGDGAAGAMADRDAEYLAAVEAGDMETAQEIVGKAAIEYIGQVIDVDTEFYQYSSWAAHSKRLAIEREQIPPEKDWSNQRQFIAENHADAARLYAQAAPFKTTRDRMMKRLPQAYVKLSPKIRFLAGIEDIYSGGGIDFQDVDMPYQELTGALVQVGETKWLFVESGKIERGTEMMSGGLNVAPNKAKDIKSLAKRYELQPVDSAEDGDESSISSENRHALVGIKLDKGDVVESADPITRDADGNVIPLSQRFNPESNDIRYSAPIDPSQSNERPTDIPERVRGAGTQVPQAEGGGNAASVLARLDAGREAAVSAAVAESDWGNYTPEQKTEALNAFIRSVYLAAEHSLRTAFRGVGGILFTRGDEGSASARGIVGAEGRLQLVLTYDNSAGFENGVKGDALARDMFAFAYDTAQEEIIHAADKVAEFRRWVAAGRPGTLNSFSNREALRTFNQINQARIDLQQTDPAAAQKIKDAMLASWEVYHNEPVEGIAGLARRLGEKGKDGFGPSAYLYELRRQLTQLKRQDFTTETGWQKFTRVLKQWLTDAINALRGVQDVFRSGMAGDLIQRQLVDLEAALDGKPLPAKGVRYSMAGENAELPQFMRDSLETAKAMAAAGKTSEEIRAVTGWFPGKYDGKMRWEVPDEGATWTEAARGLLEGTEEKSAKLGDVLKHDALFDAYPDLKDAAVSVQSLGASDNTAEWVPYANAVILNRDILRDGDNTLSVVLHELQHAIQGIEGFAKGASLGSYVGADKFYQDWVLRAELVQLADETGKTLSEAVEMYKDFPEDYASLKNALEVFTPDSDFRESTKRSLSYWKPRGSVNMFDAYNNTAGEIEARDVQARQNFTPEQRKAVAPYSSENIAKEDAIVMFGGSGPQASISTSKLSPDKARAILTKRFGKAGGKFVVGAFNADGDIEWDAKIGDGNITLNLKYLDTEAKLIAKAEHELAHAVFDDPAVQKEWKAISRTLSPAAREKLAARLKGLGYADAVLPEEMLVQTLEEIRRNTPPAAWQRFVKAVRDALLRLFGMDVSQGDAERAAARIVAAGEAALAQGLDPAVAAFGQSVVDDIRYSRVNPDAELNKQTNVQFGSEKQRNIRPAAPQQETANKASAIIGEAIAKDPVNGRMNALLRFDSDTKIPGEVRVAGAAMLAEQVEYLNVLNLRSGNASPETTDLADDFVSRAISIVQRLGTESGRTTNFFNALARLTGEGFIRRQMRQHAKGVDEVIRQNFEGDLRSDVEKAFSETPEVPEAEAVKKVRGSLPDTLAKKAIERFNALLDGPVPPGQKNPLSELIAKNIKSPVEGFKEKLIELGVDPEIADALDAVSAKLRAEYTEAARLKAIDKLLAVKTRNKTAKEKLSKVIRTVLEAGNLGALDSQQFMDLFAKEFGLPPMTKEFKAEIKEMVRGINALPKGPARIDAIQALEERLALWEGIKTRDLMMSTVYSNWLSGISTQALGLLYNNLNLLLKSVVTMLANPKSAKAFVKGALGEGLRTGLKEALAALQGKGLYKVSKWGDKRMIDSLGLLSKQGPRGAAQWAAYLASAGTLTRKVFHLMAAVDALSWNTAREGHAYLAAHRALREELAGTNPTVEEFNRKFVEKLGGDTAQIEADLKEARDQLIKAGKTPDLTTIDRMAKQVRDDRRAEAGVDLQSSNRFADRVVVQQEPEGIGRFVNVLITAFQQLLSPLGLPVGQMLIPFNKIVSNLFEQSLDYTPVGIVRGALGGHLTDVVEITKDGIKFREGSKMFDSTERWERAITGTLATSIGFALYALAASMKDEDDEDVPFMVYAFGPTDKNKRSQMPKGWAPFTIKIGDVYYKFAEAPFGMMFAGIGSVLDAIRYEKADNKTATEKITYLMMRAGKGFMTQGVLSSVDTAIDVITGQASGKRLSDIPVSAMKGAIPGQGLLRDLSTLTDDRKIDGSTMKAALLRDIPFVKSYAGRPELNAFGEPVTFDGYPVVRRFVNGVEKNHVADYLGRNDLYIPGMPPTIEVGSYLPKEMKDRLQRRALEVSAMENGMFTPEQNYEFKKRAGQLTKVAVERIMSASPPITNDVQRKKVQSVLNKQIEIARKRAMLEAVPIK